MAVTEFIKGELIEIIEWTDDSRNTLVHRFPDDDKAVKNGAQLIVRESQHAQLVYLGQFGDTFGPGKHRLTTGNIPVLTSIRSWKYAFESPFKVDIYFLNTRLFTGNKWGTAHPVMMRDTDLGVVRARAFGTYDFRITNPPLFLKEVAGSDHDVTVEEFIETMRSRIASVFSDALASANLPVFDIASRYAEIGEALLPIINPIVTSRYGLEIPAFVLENVSVPREVEEAIDTRSSIAAIGDLNEYVKYQLAQGMAKGSSSAGVASEMAVGLSVAQQILQQQGFGRAAGASIPELMSPAEVAGALGVPEQDVMSVIDSGELAAKKIGASFRVRRSDLESYLNR